MINDVFKEWQKWESTVSQFHENLVAIPDIIAQVEIAQAQLGNFLLARSIIWSLWASKTPKTLQTFQF